MSIASEASNAPTALQAALDAGLNALSNTQTIYFQTYTKSTMPLDGYVFWVANGDSVPYVGSVHQITSREQEQDQTAAVNKIIFTSESEIAQFNVINSQTLMVGSWVIDGVTKKMVFNDHAALYLRAGLYHYSGDTVYPALESQLINVIGDLPTGPIVSNSLPIWLSQNSIAPVYASYLVPANITPPYVAVHISPDETEVIGQFPIYGWPGTLPRLDTTFILGSSALTGVAPLYSMPSSQLMRDKVEFTLYGFTNKMAIQYLASLADYSLMTDNFGFCNSPAIRDEKRTQSEISAIAMKKSITIQASYYQSAADAIARRLLVHSTVSFSFP